MRFSRLLWIFLFASVLVACDVLESINQAPPKTTSSVDVHASPSPYIPSMDTPANPTPGDITQSDDLIGTGNVQSLQVGSQLSEGKAKAFSWLSDSDRVALAVEQGVMLYEIEGATVADHLTAPFKSNLTSSTQSQWLAWISDENTIQILNTQDEQAAAEIHSPSGAITSLSLATDSGKLAFATFDNSLQVWDKQDGELKLIKDWQLPYWLTDLSFSPDGNILAGADLPNFQVHLFDLATGEEIRSLEWTQQASPALYNVEFSPDWNRLAWVARGTVLIMDVISGYTLAELSHEDFVQAIAWSVDSSILATAAAGSSDGQLQPYVYLWDSSSGALLNKLSQPGSVLSMSFSPDGRELAVLSSGGALQVWKVSP